MEAVVLRRKDVGEADRLLTVFARSMGKQRLVARGVRRTTSRMAAHLEPGRQSNLHVVERRAWPLVTQAETREVFLVPGSPLEEVRDALQLLEVVDALVEPGQRESALYDLLIAALHAQRAAEPTTRSLIGTAFSLQASAIMGYQLELTRCLKCSRPADAVDSGEPFSLSVPRGGVLHRTCSVPGPSVFSLTSEALSLLRRLAREPFGQTAAAAALAREVARPVASFLEWTSERAFKTTGAFGL